MTPGHFQKLKLTVKDRLRYFIGSGTELGLENRIFNSMMLIALFIMLFNIPFNYFSGLETTSAIFVCLTAIIGFLYYQARFKRRVSMGIAISSFLAIALLSVNYFYSGGVRGATLLSLILAFILIIIISPKKFYLIWIALSILAGLGLLWVEYRYPDTIQMTYSDRKGLFIDIAYTFGTGIVVSFFSVFYLKEAYNAEKESADYKRIELTRLNEEKLKLFSIIAHDLQTPLSSLYSYVRLVANDQFSGDERKQVERGLANALHGTQEMLSNLLVWSQDQLRGAHITVTPLRLKTVLTPVIDIQRIYAGQKGITLETCIDESLSVLADRDMIHLIVRNLINNAIKFTPSDGKIRVSASRSHARCEITVEDNGIGIPQEQQESLFSLKTRSTYGTNNERGIGLGLFLCREYAAAQNGSISFTSVPGKGTCFCLSLPLAA